MFVQVRLGQNPTKNFGIIWERHNKSFIWINLFSCEGRDKQNSLFGRSPLIHSSHNFWISSVDILIIGFLFMFGKNFMSYQALLNVSLFLKVAGCSFTISISLISLELHGSFLLLYFSFKNLDQSWTISCSTASTINSKGPLLAI